MSYYIKEIFYSLQGEGHHAGKPSVFCRFSGCNMWSGRDVDRAASVCSFCDTDFVGWRRFEEDELVAALMKPWIGKTCVPNVIFTGGEPALQLTASLIDKLKQLNATVAVETNGTLQLPDAGPYWVTVSPKALEKLVVTEGHEIKLLFPLEGIPPESVEDLDFRYYYLQPIDDDNYKENLAGAIRYCLNNPKWRLSTQGHKVWGLR